MILDVRVAWSCGIGLAEVSYSLVGFTLSQQNPTQGVPNLGSRWSSGESALGQFSSFWEITLPLIEPSEVVQSSRIGWAFGNKAHIFGDGWVVFLLLQIEAR